MTKSPFEVFRDTSWFPALDGIRCLSILLVLWHHAHKSDYSLAILERGHEGVSLFFVISGFLITTLLLREKEKTGSISLKKFFLKRSLRIFPLYYVVLLTYVVIVYFLEENAYYREAFFNNLIYFATYTSNWFVKLEERSIFYFSWSLATEEQYYLIWPFLVRLMSKFQLIAWCLLFTLLAYVFNYSSIESSNAYVNFVQIVLRSIAIPICFGSILGCLLNMPRSYAVLNSFLGYKASSSVFLLLLIASLSFFYHPIATPLIMALFVASCLMNSEHYLGRSLEMSPIVYVGKISYGIYLLHMLSLNLVDIPLRHFGFTGVTQDLLRFSLGLGVVCLAAHISYKFFEMPLIMWGRKKLN